MATDPELADAIADGFDVARIAGGESIDADQDPGRRRKLRRFMRTPKAAPASSIYTALPRRRKRQRGSLWPNSADFLLCNKSSATRGTPVVMLTLSRPRPVT